MEIVAVLRRTPLALMFCAALAACGTTTPPCNDMPFETATHMTNVIKEPFVVRELRGRVTMRDAEPGDAWVTDELQLTFELFHPDGRLRRVPISADGRFAAPELRPGRYCFRVSSPYTQAYEGTIVIDRRADADAVIEIALALGA